MKKIFFWVVPFLLCQCSSLEKSIGLGASVGAASGIATAQAAYYNTKGNVVLMLSGAAIGGAIAALLHNGPEKKEDPAPPIPLTILKEGSPPLKQAEKDVLWVPDKIEGERFEEGHRLFLIKKPAHWQHRPEDETEENDE